VLSGEALEDFAGVPVDKLWSGGKELADGRDELPIVEKHKPFLESGGAVRLKE